MNDIIKRFKKYRKGGILKFLAAGLFPYITKDISTPAIDSSLEGTGPIYRPRPFEKDSLELFSALQKINPKAHNKNTFSKAYGNMKNVYGELLKLGLSPEEISGIMGNILAENASFDPSLDNLGGYKGYVLLSKNNLNYVSEKYGDMSSDNQLLFIGDWTKGIVYSDDPSNSGHGYNRYRESLSTKTPSNYAKAWSDHFEKHGGSSSLRLKYADMFYKYFTK